MTFDRHSNWSVPVCDASKRHTKFPPSKSPRSGLWYCSLNMQEILVWAGDTTMLFILVVTFASGLGMCGYAYSELGNVLDQRCP